MNNEHEKSIEQAFAQGYQKGKHDMLESCSKPLSNMVALNEFIKIELDCKTPEQLLQEYWQADEIDLFEMSTADCIKLMREHAKEVLTLVARKCIIQDNNWHKTITQQDILQIRDSI